MLIASVILFAQDLFDRSRSETRPVVVTRDRDRIDLRLSPTLDFPRSGAERKPLGFEAEFNPSFSCNNFDFAAGFRTLFDQNVHEEFLGGALSALEGEIASNALYFACQVSPTLCDLIKHYRVAANAMLQMQYGQCQSLEQVLDGAAHRLAADSMARCLDDQQKLGKTLPEAMAFCKRSELLSNLQGQRVRDVDLVKELGDLLKLDGETRELLSQFVQPLEVNGKSVKTRLQLGGLEPLFSKTRGEFEEAWRKAVEEAGTGKISEETLKKLVPEGTAIPSGVELAWLGLIPEDRRAEIVSSVATAGALGRLTRQLHEIERALEAADHLPSTDPWKAEIERRRKWIRSELGRLEEAYRFQRLLNTTLADANDLSVRDISRAAAERLAPIVVRRLENQATRDTRPWGGTSEKIETPPKEGSACATCTQKDYGFGSVKKK